MAGEKMPRYLVTWKAVNARISADPATNLRATGELLKMVQQDLASGALKDWGVRPDGSTGYAIFEGSEQDSAVVALKYGPMFEFDPIPMLTASQWAEALEKVAQMLPIPA